jgi:hypothetical protein
MPAGSERSVTSSCPDIRPVPASTRSTCTASTPVGGPPGTPSATARRPVRSVTSPASVTPGSSARTVQSVDSNVEGRTYPSETIAAAW